MSKFIHRFPFHPFLWAVYPILALFSSNLGQVYLWMIVRSLVLSLLATTALISLMRIVFRDWHKAALTVTFLVLIFFTYGHIYPVIENVTVASVNIGRHRYLILVLSLLLIALLLWITRRKQNTLGFVTQMVNITAMILVVIPLIQIVYYQIIQASAHQMTSNTATRYTELEGLSSLIPPKDLQAPDVYFIILDAYGREDTLRDYFGYDNRPFVSHLEKLGFFVARCSQSNYSVTEFSIASALNLDYLEMSEGTLSSTTDFEEMISHSIVRQAFETMGYESVAFESGYGLTEMIDADSYYSFNLHAGLKNYLGGINAYEALLLRTSIGFLIFESFDSLPNHIRTMLSSAYVEHRTRILYTFEGLQQVSRNEGSKFVFAHILAPHSPFVFGADGQIVERSTPFTLNHDPEISDPTVYALGYNNQLTYINQRTAELVESILANAPTPPVIILIGDHGPMQRATSAAARMTNLIAIYAPPGSNLKNQLYDTITPVNIFRLIFDSVFNSHLGLIKDISYLGSRNTSSDQFTIIPNDCH